MSRYSRLRPVRTTFRENRLRGLLVKELVSVHVVAAVPTWLYVSGCVVLPLVWGVATEFFFHRVRRRRKRRKRRKDEHFFTDYHI